MEYPIIDINNRKSCDIANEIIQSKKTVFILRGKSNFKSNKFKIGEKVRHSKEVIEDIGEDYNKYKEPMYIIGYEKVNNREFYRVIKNDKEYIFESYELEKWIN